MRTKPRTADRADRVGNLPREGDRDVRVRLPFRRSPNICLSFPTMPTLDIDNSIIQDITLLCMYFYVRYFICVHVLFFQTLGRVRRLQAQRDISYFYSLVKNSQGIDDGVVHITLYRVVLSDVHSSSL